MPLGSSSPRFLTLADVAEMLSVSERQVYALVRRGDLAAIQVGGRGVWRVEQSAFEDYVARQYEATRAMVDAFDDAGTDTGADDDSHDGTDDSAGEETAAAETAPDADGERPSA